jgi:hypothetical protein
LKAPIRLALKAAFVTAALAVVAAQVDLGGIAARLGAADPRWLIAALVLFNASQVVSAARLARVLGEYRVVMAFRHHLGLYYTGMAGNLFLPGGVGGDAYKVFWLRRRLGGRPPVYVAGLLFDRGSGLAALLCLAAGAAAWWSGQAHWLAASVPVLAGYALVTARFFRRFAGAGGAALVMGLAVQGLQGAAAWALIQGMGLAGPGLLSLFLLLFFLSAVAALVPVTVGGAGARELVFLYGLQWSGAEADPGVALALAFLALTVVSALPGLALLPVYGAGRKGQPTA